MENRYLKYKSSKLLSFNEVPNHWIKNRIKYMGFMYGGLTGKSGEDFRKNEDDPSNKPFIPFTNICNNTYISKDELKLVSINEKDNQNRVKKDDLFFLMTSETESDLGKTSVLKEDIGEVYLNTFCKGYRITDKNVNPYFLNYLLYGNLYRQLLSIEGNGYTRINLRQDRVNDFIVYIPFSSEQEQIVKYLDEKTNQIDTLISLTEKKIEKLKDKRTDFINTIITKGIEPNVEMRDTGVLWIGKIPKHWEFGKLSYHTERIGDGLHSTPEYVDQSEYYFINGNNLVNGKIEYFESTKCVSQEEFKKHYIPLGENTVLLSINGTIGNLSLYNGEKVILGKSSCYINCKDTIDRRFLQYLLSSDSIKRYFSFEVTGTTIYNLSLNTVRRTPLPLPKKNEQEQIINYLDIHINEMDKLISIENRRIETLKEYRQSLISEVVTGKIRICEEDHSISNSIQDFNLN